MRIIAQIALTSNVTARLKRSLTLTVFSHLGKASWCVARRMGTRVRRLALSSHLRILLPPTRRPAPGFPFVAQAAPAEKLAWLIGLRPMQQPDRILTLITRVGAKLIPNHPLASPSPFRYRS